MNLFKSFSIVSLASLFVLNTANAEPAKSTQKTQAQQKQQTTKKTSQKQAQQQPAEDKQLKRFNESLRINYVGRVIVNNEQGQPTVVLRYLLENKSKRAIRSVHWIGAYFYNEQLFHTQDIPVNFDQPFERSKTIDVNVSIPLASFSEQVQALLASEQAVIQALAVARNITFINGSKIEVVD